MRIDSLDENRFSCHVDFCRKVIPQLSMDITLPVDCEVVGYFEPATIAWTEPIFRQASANLCFNKETPGVTYSLLCTDLNGEHLRRPLTAFPFILSHDLIQHGSINNLETIIPGDVHGVFEITWMAMDSVYSDHLLWTSCLKWSNQFS